MIVELKRELENLKDDKQAEILSRFFKTGKGEYGFGDKFLGVKVPVQRKVAKKYELNFKEIQELLNSSVHEHRFISLVILIGKDDKRKVFDFYLKNSLRVNNWDLVDISAPKIVGNYLLNKDRKVLYSLAKSKILWKRRIAIVSCFSFIRENDFKDALKISELLLNDKHDLIHKAVGWMLREVGKRDEKVLEKFLCKFCKRMPRVMLRYAIEKFDEKKRKDYLNGN